MVIVLRRRRSSRRAVLLAVIAAAGLCSWSALGKPGHLPGLALAIAVVLAARSAIVALAAVAVPGIVSGLVPRTMRIRYRRDHARPWIRARLRRAVLAADRRRCLHCGSRADLQLDHVRPWSAGGLTTGFNLACLCRRCNRVKSNYHRDRYGYVHYRPWRGSDDIAAAAAICATELRGRRSPARWARLIVSAR